MSAPKKITIAKNGSQQKNDADKPIDVVETCASILRQLTRSHQILALKDLQQALAVMHAKREAADRTPMAPAGGKFDIPLETLQDGGEVHLPDAGDYLHPAAEDDVDVDDLIASILALEPAYRAGVARAVEALRSAGVDRVTP